MAEPTPVEMLKADHRQVGNLFEKYRLSENPEEKIQLAKEIFSDLEIHANLEEKVFYPEVENASPEGSLLIADSRREHQQMKEIINDLRDLDTQDTSYEIKMVDLENIVNHHVNDEETKVFPFAEANIDDQMGVVMTTKMMALKGTMRVEKML